MSSESAAGMRCMLPHVLPGNARGEAPTLPLLAVPVSEGCRRHLDTLPDFLRKLLLSAITLRADTCSAFLRIVRQRSVLFDMSAGISARICETVLGRQPGGTSTHRNAVITTSGILITSVTYSSRTSGLWPCGATQPKGVTLARSTALPKFR
jgi:hypothetical protein